MLAHYVLLNDQFALIRRERLISRLIWLINSTVIFLSFLAFQNRFVANMVNLIFPQAFSYLIDVVVLPLICEYQILWEFGHSAVIDGGLWAKRVGLPLF